MAFTTFQLETPALASGVWELARPAEFSDDVQPDHANFSDVSCTSPGNCTAVGGFERNIDDTYTTEAFTVTMTNGEWTLARPAEFGEGIQNETPYADFESVSCTSQGNCTAVGYFDNSSGDKEAFTMTMTNGEWQTAQPAEFGEGIQNETPVAGFESVSCATPGNCTAVGNFENSSGDQEAFTMTSTNGEWQTAQPAQFEEDLQDESLSSYFTSVSCATPGNCTAVGHFSNSSIVSDAAFTMTSTDGEWQTAQPAVFDDEITSEYPFANFFSVSCASPGNCTAVGYFENSSGYIEAFTMTSTNGEWQTAQPAVFDDGVTSEYPASGFESVSCASPGNCTAVGFFENSDDFRRAFTMTSTDGEWELARPAEFAEGVQGNVSGQGFGTYLRSVSCASPGNCTAVGSFTNRDEINEPFTMTSTNGEWELAQPAQFAEGVQFINAGFNSVSCASPGNCTAVGSFFDFSDGNSSTDAFTMTSTREMPERARPAQFADGIQFDYARFNSVSCATPGNCTAVGFFEFPVDGQDDPAREAFTMTSTDGEWELARPAEFGDGIQQEAPKASFRSVSCASPGNCTAVGEFRNSSGDQEAFTMTMTDGEWETPQPAVFEDDTQDETPDAKFESVSCASPGNCTAVGEFADFTNTDRAFTMTLTEGVWELAQPAVFDEDLQNELTDAGFRSVSCAAPGSCTAVGSFERNSDDGWINEAFTMTMTDGEWETAQPAEFEADIQDETPNAGFESVSCATPGNCTAVGYFRNSSGDQEAFTMTSTDGEWETAQPAVFEDDIQDETPDAKFESVSCASPGNCTAVGEFSADGDDTMAFIMTMTDGEWETAQPAVFEDDIQNELTWAWFDSVSCASPGNCTAVGGFERNYTTEAFTMTTGDDTYSSQPDSAPSPTTTAPSPTTTAPSPTTTAPSPTTTAPSPIPSPTTTQPKRVTKRNTQKVAPVVPAKSTSTTTAILEDVAQTTLAPEPQSPINTQPGHGSLGWWILGGSSIIGGSFIISAWWITHSLRRFQITKPSAVTVNS
jgi:hypothetical protein